LKYPTEQAASPPTKPLDPLRLLRHDPHPITSFTDALLALQIAVDALHATSKASPEAEYAAHEAFDQIMYLGLDTRHSEEGKPGKTFAGLARKPVQRNLFP
jgi:hypothetical protein